MNINTRYIRDNNIVAVKPFEKLDIIHRHFESFQQARKILNVCMFDCVSNEINMDVYRKAFMVFFHQHSCFDEPICPVCKKSPNITDVSCTEKKI